MLPRVKIDYTTQLASNMGERVQRSEPDTR